MNKIILSLIVVSILVLPVVSFAEDSMTWTPMFGSKSSVSSPQSYVISSTPGTHFTYGNGGGISITSSGGGVTTFLPNSNLTAPPGGLKVITCVNSGSVSSCY